MAYRGLDKLQPGFRKKVELLMEELKDEIFITETRRSQDRQDQLYAQGRTAPGNIVTRTTHSLHSDGLAIDIAFLGNNLYPSDVSRWQVVYDIARKYGIDNLRETDRLEKPHLQDNGKPLVEIDEGDKRHAITRLKALLIATKKESNKCREYMSTKETITRLDILEEQCDETYSYFSSKGY